MTTEDERRDRGKSEICESFLRQTSLVFVNDQHSQHREETIQLTF
jgi:hypothetical protein